MGSGFRLRIALSPRGMKLRRSNKMRRRNAFRLQAAALNVAGRHPVCSRQITAELSRSANTCATAPSHFGKRGGMAFRSGTRRWTALAALIGYVVLGSRMLRAPDEDSHLPIPVASRTRPAKCCCGPDHHAGDGCCCTSTCSTTEGPCLIAGPISGGEQVAAPLEPFRLGPHEAGVAVAVGAISVLMTGVAPGDDLPESVRPPPPDKVPLRA